MNARFHLPGDLATGLVLPLPEDEGSHLKRVLRLSVGDPVAVFDGRGHEFAAVIEHAGKAGVRVRLLEARTPAAEAAVAVTLVQSVLKGDKMDDVVRDAVMMGVVAVQPLLSVRAEVTRIALERGRRVERWQRIAVSSVKQCGRAVVPAIHPPLTLEQFLAHARYPGPHGSERLMFVEPSARATATPLIDLDPAAPASADVLVGPEGGWTAEEIALASSSCRLVSLGGRVLRGDAVPLVGLAALYTIWRAL